MADEQQRDEVVLEAMRAELAQQVSAGSVARASIFRAGAAADADAQHEVERGVKLPSGALVTLEKQENELGRIVAWHLVEIQRASTRVRHAVAVPSADPNKAIA